MEKQIVEVSKCSRHATKSFKVATIKIKVSQLPRRIVPWVLALCALGGCGQPIYELTPVSGLVTIDGHPVTEAKVMFAPIAKGEKNEAGKPAFGLLGADGRFVLTTYEDADGAIVGEHWVTIIPIETEVKGWPTPKEAKTSSTKVPKFNRLTVPRTVRVVAGEDNHIDIKLKAEDVAKFSLKSD